MSVRDKVLICHKLVKTLSPTEVVLFIHSFQNLNSEV